jgi:two-component system, OmpR family, response regulator RegX3
VLAAAAPPRGDRGVDAGHILIVDDEASYRDALTAGLTSEGFSVDAAATYAEALEYFAARQPNLVLLDIMLPDGSGLDLCRELRARTAVPIIFLSAKSAEIDVVLGLEMGATDYVAKPFRLRELAARIRANLRRQGAATPAEDVIAVSGIVLDSSRRTCLVRDVPVELTRMEFDLLWFLLTHVGVVVTREECIDAVWWDKDLSDSRTLDSHIKRLRQKLEEHPGEPQHIITVRGVGFRFDA